MSGNSWVGKHKKELLAALAVGGVGALTGGFGLLGAGAGAAEGAGAAAGEGLAGGLGAGAADEVTGGSLLSSGYGASPLTQGVDTLTRGFNNSNLGPTLDKFGKVQRVASLLNPQQPPVPPMQMPQSAPQSAPLSNMPSMAQTYPTNIGASPQMGPEELRRLLAMMQQRGGYG